jgi:hypothetical protein
MENFFIVVKGDSRSLNKHQDIHDALDEAARFAAKMPRTDFYIMRSAAFIRTEGIIRDEETEKIEDIVF